MIIHASRPTSPTPPSPLRGNYLRRALGDAAIDSLPSPDNASSLLSTVPTAPPDSSGNAATTLALTIPGVITSLTNASRTNQLNSLYAMVPPAPMAAPGMTGRQETELIAGAGAALILLILAAKRRRR